MMQSQTPRTMRAVPSRAWPRRVSSPRITPKTAVAANVVALVTGTVREIGVWLRMAKKLAEAEILMRNGTVYCQINSRFTQFLIEATSFWRRLDGGLEDATDRSWRSQRTAPRRISALVAPQTRPTATIFSASARIIGLLSPFFCPVAAAPSAAVRTTVKYTNPSVRQIGGRGNCVV